MTGIRRRATLIVAGRVATLAREHGMGWADAVAVADGDVLASGRRAELDPLVGPRTRTLELAPDEVAIPTLSDAHLHLIDAALAEGRVDLAGLRPGEALERIRAAHLGLPDPETWLEGDGWHPDTWGSWPDADDLERVAPRRRAAFWAHDRHALWVSPRVLDEAGLADGSPDPPGGVVRRRADGSPSGVLHETAAALALRLVPAASIERRVDGLRRLLPRLVAAGLASVHDPGPLSPEPGLAAVEAYRALEMAGALPLDVHVSVRRESLAAAVRAGLRSGDPLLRDLSPDRTRARVGWLKLFADGTMGSRTAAMLQPFEGAPVGEDSRERGLFQVGPEELAELVEAAASAGIASQIHAIGDAATRAALDALAGGRARVDGLQGGAVARAARRHAQDRGGLAPRIERAHDRPGLPPRIEHAQLVDPADVPRFADLGVVASVQPCHLATDAPTARTVWGRRAERAYGYRSLLEAGATLAFGTDAPIESWDPWPGIEQAVTRRGAGWKKGTPPLGRSESLDVASALRAAAIGPARAEGRADRGRLVPGHRADLLVVPAEAFGEPVEPGGPLGRVRPRLVILRGEIVAER